MQLYACFRCQPVCVVPPPPSHNGVDVHLHKNQSFKPDKYLDAARSGADSMEVALRINVLRLLPLMMVILGEILTSIKWDLSEME